MRKSALAVAAVAALAIGCGDAGRVTGPSPVEPAETITAPAATKVTAVVLRDGVLLKAERLDKAQQVEGVLEWVPTSLWYQSFQQGEWWFAAEEWEWAMVPQEGRVYWGVWRGDGVSGDGMLGFIRLEGMPSVKGLQVWVDGRPVDVATEHRGGERRGGADDDLAPAVAALGGAQGPADHRWSIGGLSSPR